MLHCIFHKLPGDTAAAGPRITLRVERPPRAALPPSAGHSSNAKSSIASQLVWRFKGWDMLVT